ncbi:DNA glycosylase AlkZ-like family protein [Pseudonocardia abyssalis]|uniref:Winged helix DNA-binding domain-containing protein n=1 Tax=Pseudonocardia abyssalis TaxID=2792008 RepID=A0ABS6UPF1_9PSEU|nr:crosslink repair DNA glycosylase YcaQ family protein [Pseudonocardia abyssalis]MBW0116811.1 winged helix DNA-binding domain-containing protein [Pseudonocardia abyssalis]MBW0134097.1 winged helix DNA-binding domain-containing protein [Pseudonocardia abyssalis]
MDLTREQVLTHRLHAHGLVERVGAPADIAVLDLGVQNSPPGSLPLALSARLQTPLGPADDLTDGGELTQVWSHRGAPHLHRTADLAALAAACWPRDDADAAARLGWQKARLAEAGGAARAAFRTVADAVRSVLTAPMTKADLSTAVTAVVPAELSPYCSGCGVQHVGEQLLRVTGLAAGVRLRGSRPLVLEPIPGRPGPPADADAGTVALQRSYLRFFAPSTEVEIAAFLGTSRSAAAADRPRDLVAVRVGGRSAAAPPEIVDAVLAAEPEPVVRLLPPSDPWLQSRDREVLVPDAALRKAIWKPIGSPGVVLSGIDVVGTWRAKQKGRTLRLEIAWSGRRVDLGEEPERLAAVRGSAGVEVV